MTAAECASILRDEIRHREKMHTEPCIFIGQDREKTQGTVNVENDLLYHALKFALSCVEGKV